MKKIIISVVIVCSFVLVFPFIINYIYRLNPPLDVFRVDFESKDLLAYYGVVFSFLGTIVLSAITIYQSKKAQEQTDKVNQLMLTLQQKSLEIAEKQFDESSLDKTTIPKFEIKMSGYNGWYSDPTFLLRNVTSNIVSNISFITFCVKNMDDKIIKKARSLSPNYTSLGPNEMCEVKTIFPGLKGIDIETINFILEFSCEDEKGNVHYFRSKKTITNLKKCISGEIWKIEKVG